MTDMHLPDYRAGIDGHELDPDTPTNRPGLVVGAVAPIGDAVLTPGDPSPVGRCADGDLVYPERLEATTLSLTRRDAARLAHLLARASGIAHPPVPPIPDDQVLLKTCLDAAVPSVFFTETAHGRQAYRQAQTAVLAGAADAPGWPAHLGRDRPT